MKTVKRTYINERCVGGGWWTLEAVRRYCLLKGITLISLHYESYERRTSDVSVYEVDIVNGGYKILGVNDRGNLNF